MRAFTVRALYLLASAVALLCLPTDARAEDAQARSNTIRVRIIDANSEGPLSGVELRSRGKVLGTTGINGWATVPAPTTSALVHIDVQGYAHGEFRLKATGPRALLVPLTPLEGDIILVLGRPRSLKETFRPATVLEGRSLVENLGGSVSESLGSVPGFANAYNGPGASSPTLRGMGGDRVLVLEDGVRVGDLYWSASDHGVTSEPLTSRRIEVVRGPAGLLYGANALGGVVNVVRDDIPQERPDRAQAAASAQADSATLGTAQAMELLAPVGPLAMRAEASLRHAGNTRTPLGTLERTDLSAQGASLGASHIGAHHSIGLSGRAYLSRYGVPGEFGGEMIPGGHAGGVHIETRRLGGHVRGSVHQDLGPFEGIEFDANAVRYQHDEIEDVLAGNIAYGARFEQLTTSGLITAHHDHATKSRVAHAGAVGLAWRTTDLDAFGSAPGSRSGTERSVGILGYDEIRMGKWGMQGGLRFDVQGAGTLDPSPIRVRTSNRTIEKPVADRTFHALSASLAATYQPSEVLLLGVSFARSFRAPSLPELYSDGPHLADFSFNIGSPDLDKEVGHGLDAFARLESEDTELEIAAYANHVSGYIYNAPTGETIRVILEGSRPTETPVFEARGQDATFIGAEGSLKQRLGKGFDLSATASYTRAALRSGDPLPSIPPLVARLGLGRDFGKGVHAFAAVRLGAAQNRVPRAIEVLEESVRPQEPTGSYALLDAGGSWRMRHHGEEHLLSLRITNALDSVWRDHLSRIKDVAPQPGISAQLTYRYSM